MIDYLRGRLISFTGDQALLEVGHLGVVAQLPAPDRERLIALHQGTAAPPNIHLYTHLVIRPEEWLMFGFLEEATRDLFRVLLEIQGVGPRVALALVSYVSIEELRAAVEAKETRPLERVPGIGKRTAERILLELSGKLRKRLGEGPAAARSPEAQNAIEALIALGIAQPEAGALVRLAERELSDASGARADASTRPPGGAGPDAGALVAAALRLQRAPRDRK
ncbi:MAG: Holliday junction branch migration protein RuvA [Candidatus Eisenbacteria bacterium]|nr:Holliday junction branch migration protein RuvA [Candidatus Eisenbacteria bacterium]